MRSPYLFLLLCGCAISPLYERAEICKEAVCCGSGIGYREFYSVFPSDIPGFFVGREKVAFLEGYIEQPFYNIRSVSFALNILVFYGKRWDSNPQGNLYSNPEKIKYIGVGAGLKTGLIDTRVFNSSIKLGANVGIEPLVEGGLLLGIKFRGKEVLTFGIKGGFPYFLPHSYPAFYLLAGNENIYLSVGFTIMEKEYYNYYGGVYMRWKGRLIPFP